MRMCLYNREKKVENEKICIVQIWIEAHVEVFTIENQ